MTAANEDLARRRRLGDLVWRWTAAQHPSVQPASHNALRFRHEQGHRLIVNDDDAARFHVNEVALSDRRDVWLVMPTHARENVTDYVRESGLILHPPQKLMSRDLAGHPFAEPPKGYELTMTRTCALVTRNGVEVACGRMSVAGQDAVAFDVRTDFSRRRRGLGRVVLGALVRDALEDGATTGLLCSPESGLAFFQALGWQDEADVVTAYKP